MRATFWSLVVIVALSLGLSSAAQAQTSVSDRAEARSLFAAGQAAVDAGRWTDALDAFHRAYVLTRAPSALFNAAFALRALGRYQEAEAAFEELLRLPDVRRPMVVEATGYLEEVRRRIGGIALDGLPDDAITTVHLDGDGVADDGTRPLVLRANPGHHALDVSLSSRVRFEWAGTLADGQTLHVAVSLPFEPGAAGAHPTSVVEEPWLWIVIGLGVVAIGGAIAGGVIADQQAQLQPQSSMTFTF